MGDIISETADGGVGDVRGESGPIADARGSGRAMEIATIVGLVLALAGFAYRFPVGYRLVYEWLFMVLIVALAGAIGWNLALAYSAAQAAHANANNLANHLRDHLLPQWLLVFVAPLLAVYVWLLRDLRWLGAPRR